MKKLRDLKHLSKLKARFKNQKTDSDFPNFRNLTFYQELNVFLQQS